MMKTMLYATTGRDATELRNEAGAGWLRSFGALLLAGMCWSQSLVAQSTNAQLVVDQRQRYRHPAEAVADKPVAMPDAGPVATNLDVVRAAVGYPAIAQNNGMEGNVTVRVLVDAQGIPTHWVLPHGAKHQALADAVLAQVPNLRFRPATLSGTSVACWVTLPFRFQLN